MPMRKRKMTMFERKMWKEGNKDVVNEENDISVLGGMIDHWH